MSHVTQSSCALRDAAQGQGWVDVQGLVAVHCSGLAGWVVHSVPHGAKLSCKCIYIRSGRVTVAIYMSDPTIALYLDTGSVSTREEGASVVCTAPGVMGHCASLVSKLDHRCIVSIINGSEDRKVVERSWSRQMTRPRRWRDSPM